MLHRVLEPEVMDSPREAIDYDAMDHAEVNRAFVAELLAAGPPAGEVLDLGTGTAQIPIELCRRFPATRAVAVDLAASMLAKAAENVERAGLASRIALEQVDAKRLPYAEGRFAVVMSNSIVHHVPDPLPVLAEAVRVASVGGLIFFRDLLRPADDRIVRHLVDTHAAGANAHQRKMFDDSLRAALSLDEIADRVAQVGFDPSTVSQTSDRHWTWTTRKP